MFEYAKMKAELEEKKYPVHGKTATVTFVDGQIKLDNVCCEQHLKKLNEMLPEIEGQQNAEDILEDVF